jgi:hypothetical protein
VIGFYLADLDRDEFSDESALHGNGFGIIQHQRGLVVAESGDFSFEPVRIFAKSTSNLRNAAA